MRVGIYTGANHPIAPALREGFASRGVGAFVRCSEYFRKVKECDLAVVYGARSGATVRAAHEAAGIPVVTCDWGYMARVNARAEYESGHFQVGLGGLNSPPAFDCPPDRFEALGLDIAQSGGDPNGYVLLIGQVPGDAAHGMNDRAHARWLAEVAGQHEDVRYRPHPRGGIPLDGVPLADGSLAEALAGARLVVTWNSNAGHEALLAGVPVVAHGPAAYADLCGERLPSLPKRRAYFHRLAYGQWTLAEMRSGEAVRFILDHLVLGRPVEFTPEPEQPVESATKKRRRARAPRD